MVIPNFFIAGMPKSGTTSLHNYLSTHPNVFLSTPKEPHFFAEDMAYRGIKTLKSYNALFKNVSDEHTCIGEASVHYMYSNCAIPNIAKFNPHARFIVMFRNPVDMLYSFHSQNVYNLIDDVTDFEKAWNLQERRSRGEAIPSTCTEPKLLQYNLIGQIGVHTQKLLDYFPKEQTLFILYDDFIANAQASYYTALKFLGIPIDNRQEFLAANQNKTYRSKKLQQVVQNPPVVIQWIANTPLRHLAGKIRAQLHEMNRAKTKRLPLSSNFRKELSTSFHDEIIMLSQLINRDLSMWIES